VIVKGRASKDDPSVTTYSAGRRHHRPHPQADGKQRVLLAVRQKGLCLRRGHDLVPVTAANRKAPESGPRGSRRRRGKHTSTTSFTAARAARTTGGTLKSSTRYAIGDTTPVEAANPGDWSNNHD
jgi:hypothetical protein